MGGNPRQWSVGPGVVIDPEVRQGVAAGREGMAVKFWIVGWIKAADLMIQFDVARRIPRGEVLDFCRDKKQVARWQIFGEREDREGATGAIEPVGRFLR